MNYGEVWEIIYGAEEPWDECYRCGAIVRDRDIHTKWHKELDGETAEND